MDFMDDSAIRGRLLSARTSALQARNSLASCARLLATAFCGQRWKCDAEPVGYVDFGRISRIPDAHLAPAARQHLALPLVILLNRNYLSPILTHLASQSNLE